MLAQTENCFLALIVPYQNVSIIPSLPRCNQPSRVRNCKTCDLVIMASQEVLVVWIGQVSHNDGRPSDHDEVLLVGVQEDALVDQAGVADGVV